MPYSRRAAVALLSAFAVALAAAAPSSDIISLGQVEFAPADFVSGDIVSAYARLEIGAAPWREETVSTGLPDSGRSGVRVLSASIEKKSGAPLLVVRFIAWRPGPGVVPAMSVGGLEIPPLRFDCGSALSGGDKSAPLPLTQMDPPGLFARVYVAGGAFLLLAIGAGVVAVKLGPWLRTLSARWAYAQARRDFDAMLEGLRSGSGGPAEWAALCSGLRRFVGIRAGSDWSALTAADVRQLPLSAVPGAVCPDAALVLAMGDEARFAGRIDMSLPEGLALALSIADRLDRATAAVPAAAAAIGQPEASASAGAAGKAGV